MTVKGQAFKALQMALYASTIGGLISAFSLLFLAPLIAKITLLFGPAEYFALAVFGLSVIAGVSNDSIFKGLIAACLGFVHDHDRRGFYQRYSAVPVWSEEADGRYRPHYCADWYVRHL